MNLEDKIYYSLLSGAFLFNPVAFVGSAIGYKVMVKSQNKSFSKDVQRLENDDEYIVNKLSKNLESKGIDSSDYKKEAKENIYGFLYLLNKYKPFEKAYALIAYSGVLLMTQTYNQTKQTENVYREENISIYQKSEFEPPIARYSLFGKMFEKEVSHSLFMKDLENESTCYIFPIDENISLMDSFSIIQRCEKEFEIPKSLIKSQ
jgi:hypothetical protein